MLFGDINGIRLKIVDVIVLKENRLRFSGSIGVPKTKNSTPLK
jgi:hypothetical protein